MNPFINSILAGIKAIFGMPHDATEAEVDAKIQTLKTHEQLTASLRAEIMADRSGDEEFLKIKADLDAAQAALNDTRNDGTVLESNLEKATANVARLETELTAAKAEIERLEKLPAAAHTNGDAAPPGSGNESKKIYLDSPANQQARAMAANLKMKFPQPN